MVLKPARCHLLQHKICSKGFALKFRVLQPSVWVLLIWNSLYHLQRTIAIIYQRTEAWGYSNRVPELEMLLLMMELAPQTTQTLLFCLWWGDFPVSSVWMPMFHPSKNGIKQAQIGWRKVQTRQNLPGGAMWGRLKSDLILTLPRDTASSAQIPLSWISFFLRGWEVG